MLPSKVYVDTYDGNDPIVEDVNYSNVSITKLNAPRSRVNLP